ncbi:NACHT domain-containing protein [Streptomyces sp. B1866]|uniref:NACHT domain-containing protein n=1 Tax=Streptomyces sp. B1866 TaxID=3075431 RepID=UPI00288D98BD|nr:NACHT domain-containing protein [Streptomyces sp. B1866]MDT3396486.1 NACHT domain-containing protein [Streptomyces sp. B1866]
MAVGDGGGSKVLGRVGLLALAVAPAAAVGVWTDAAARHPVPAALLAVGYELLLALAAFAVKVSGEVQGRLAKRAADRLESALLARFSRFESRYRRYLAHHHGVSRLGGLEVQGSRVPRLEDVFVDVSLRRQPLPRVGSRPLAGAVPPLPEGERLSLHELLQAGEPAVLALIGPPGTGKTTLLEHTAYTLARIRRRRRGTGRDLPVLLLLRDHAQDVTARAGDGMVPDPLPPPSLPDVIRRSLVVAGLADAPPGWFEDQLARGRCVVMLDGLDEVAREQDRQLMVQWVGKQIARYADNHWVITSRPHGYLSSPLDGATVLQVRRFTPDQVTRFVRGWYRAVERIDPQGGAGDGWEAQAERLLERLRAEPMLYDLASNPLLLTMIANVHRYLGALPGTRAELYAQICRVLLWKRKGLDQAYGQTQEKALGHLAHVMMTRKIRDFSRGQAVLQVVLDAAGFAGTADAFLSEVARTGLLVERELGRYAFAHQTFQEYLAAAHIYEHVLEEVLVRAVGDSWWRETTLLWAARTDPSEVIDACIADGCQAAMALAFDCYDEAMEAGRSLASAGRLEALRREGLAAPPGSPQRRLMTAVTLARHLRPTVRLGDGTLVCARPVSRAVYGLFTDEHPEFASDVRPEGAADDGAPVVGVSPEAALAFVDWVGETLDAPDRLPSEAEAADPAMRRVVGAERAPWLRPPVPTRNGVPVDRPSLRLPEDMPHPWGVQRGVVAARFVQDCRALSPVGRIGDASVAIGPDSPVADLAARLTDRARGLSPLVDFLASTALLPRPDARDRYMATAGAAELRAALEYVGDLLLCLGAVGDALASGAPDGPLSGGTLDRVLGRASLVAALSEVGRHLPGAVRYAQELVGDQPLRTSQWHAELVRLHGYLRSCLDRVGRLLPVDSGGLTAEDARSFLRRCDLGPDRETALLSGVVAALATELARQVERTKPFREESRFGTYDFLSALARWNFGQMLGGGQVYTTSPRSLAWRLYRLTVLSERPNGLVAGLADELRLLGTALLEPGGFRPVPAAVVRFGALALAATDPPEHEDSVRLCHDIAAGFTVLLDRADGTLVPRDTIVLVRA